MKNICKKFVILLLGVSLLGGCGEQSNNEYTVTFYNDKVVYLVQNVKSGECVNEPEKPTKKDQTFLYWCSDIELKNRYDFSTPVISNLSLYSCFENDDPFKDYSDKFHPVNAPFICEQNFFEGDEDISIILKIDGIQMNHKINHNQIRLSGGFEDLTVTNVSVEFEKVEIKTKGKVKNDTSYVTFSKATNSKGIFLTMPFEINQKLVPTVRIDKSSFVYEIKKRNIFFSVKTEYQSFKHDSSITPDDLLVKNEDGTYKYFSISEDDGLELTILNIHEDFNGLDAQLHVKSNFKEETINHISQNVKFNISGDILEDEKNYELGFDLSEPKSISSLMVTPVKSNTYAGTYRIHLIGRRYTQELVSNIPNLLKSPYNKNLFMSIPEAEVTIETINKPNDFEIYGKVRIVTENEVLSDASISLNDIQIEENTIHLMRNVFNDELANLPIETTKVVLGYDSSKTGTIDQDDGSNYFGVKSIVQDLAMEKEESTIDQLIEMGTMLGKVAYGAYSGDYIMVGEAIGKTYGIDFLRNPSYLMLDKLAGIMDKLLEIENQIQILGEKIEELKKELEEIGQTAYLNAFISAFGVWSSFKSDYYKPMVDEMGNFTTSYYRYYYDLAMASHPETTEESSINIYYDMNGKLLFPSDNGIYSVDGQIIDKTKTKKVVFPELDHTLSGIRHNKGRSYINIENDFVADLLSRGTYSDDELSEILKTTTFNAMKKYFSTQDRMDKFTNVFRDFVTSITSSDISTSVNVSPLECFSIMLKTIFNFGFEIEPDLNLAIVKLQSTFYAAKKVFNFVRTINSGDIGRYDRLIEKAQKELTDTRFYKSNDENGNAYCFASNCYINPTVSSYAIHFRLDWDNKASVKLIENDYQNPNAEEMKEYVSVDEDTLAFMRVKVKVYNMVKNTNYSFKGYLGRIGIIPKELYALTLGVLTKIDGIVSGDKTYNLTVPRENNYIDEVFFDSPYGDGSYVRNKNTIKEFDRLYCEFVYAIKGNMFSFEDEQYHTMIVSFATAALKDATGGYYRNGIGFFGSDVDLETLWTGDLKNMLCVYAYYVAFKVVQ